MFTNLENFLFLISIVLIVYPLIEMPKLISILKSKQLPLPVILISTTIGISTGITVGIAFAFIPEPVVYVMQISIVGAFLCVGLLIKIIYRTKYDVSKT